MEHLASDSSPANLSYMLIAALEKRVYPKPNLPLVAVSHKTAG